MKCPTPRILGVEGAGNAAHRRHRNCISHGTFDWRIIYRDHLESQEGASDASIIVRFSISIATR
jgi:hypothetical protein